MGILGKIDGISFDEKIFLKGHSYGYKINIFHEALSGYLERYKKHVKSGRWPLSDTERLVFEAYMYRLICDAIEKAKPLTLHTKSE